MKGIQAPLASATIASLLTELRCTACNSSFPKQSRFFLCPACGGLLDPQYDYRALEASAWQSFATGARSIWRWRALLPIEHRTCEVSLGEGDTPLVHCVGLGAKLGLERLFIKNDGLNPTGSLKDRSIAVAVSKALELGFRCVSTDSSGNKAASLAAYAARAGLEAVVFCPAGTPTPKLLQTCAHGARLVMIEGRRLDVSRLYAEVARRHEGDWYDVGSSNPFRYEGKKTYAYELGEAFGGQGPDWLLQPAGGSMSVTKAWKGFNELQRIGLAAKAPRLVAVQAEGCAPIVEAFCSDAVDVHAVEPQYTIAGGLAIADPGQMGTLTLRAVRESGGVCVAVSESEIRWGMRELAREGIFAEPTGAVTIAALRRLTQERRIGRDEDVVCVVTGIGFKDVGTIGEGLEVAASVAPHIDAIEAELARSAGRSSHNEQSRG